MGTIYTEKFKVDAINRVSAGDDAIAKHEAMGHRVIEVAAREISKKETPLRDGSVRIEPGPNEITVAYEIPDAAAVPAVPQGAAG